MNNKMQRDPQIYLRNDVPLFMAMAAWAVSASSLAYISANFGKLKAITFMEYINHSLVSVTCTVVGVLGMFCLCCGLAKVVFRSGYKQFSKKGF